MRKGLCELRESQDFGMLKSFIRGQFSGSLSSYSLILACPPTPRLFCLRTFPDLHMDPLAKMELIKAVGRLMSSRPMSWNYLLSLTRRSLSAYVVSPYPPKKESSKSLLS